MKKKDLQQKIKTKKVFLHKSGKVSSYWIQQKKETDFIHMPYE